MHISLSGSLKEESPWEERHKIYYIPAIIFYLNVYHNETHILQSSESVHIKMQ